MTFDFEKIFDESLKEYLRDESNLNGDAVDSIVFPETAEQVSSFLKENRDTICIVSGARTGVVGGAVPKKINQKKHSIISLTKCNRISELEVDGECAFVTVGAGVSLYELEEKLVSINSPYFFPVDPTERWASFGGVASTNASGARSYFYSSVRKWIQELEIVRIDGTIMRLTRGEQASHGLPYIKKPFTKNAIGYFSQDGSDLIDLFIGAEGTLGIITSLKIILSKRPAAILSQLQFFKSSDTALNFVEYLRDNFKSESLSIEFLDARSVEIARAQFEQSASEVVSNQITDICSRGYVFSVFVEFGLSSEDDFVGIYERLSEFLESESEDISNSICGTSESEIQIIKKFRHSVPEGINRRIALAKINEPSLRKVATDMSAPKEKLKEVYALYNNTLSQLGLDYCIMGHAGDSHFHVNLLPKTKQDMDRALEVYGLFADKIVEMGGAVSAEHGIGRIKKEFLKKQLDATTFSYFRDIKHTFDPENRLNPGILFD